MQGYSYRPQTEQSSGPGRPRYRISLEQLSCLRSEFNSWTQIASDLGVSQLFTTDAGNLAFHLTLKVIPTSLIKTLTLQFLRNSEPFPTHGRQMLMAGLRRHIFIQRWRVRESIIRVDPINHANRWGHRIEQ